MIDRPLLSDPQARDAIFIVAALAMFAIAVRSVLYFKVCPRCWPVQVVVGTFFAAIGCGLLALRFPPNYGRDPTGGESHD